jgi:hypothetical protein
LVKSAESWKKDAEASMDLERINDCHGSLLPTLFEVVPSEFQGYFVASRSIPMVEQHSDTSPPWPNAILRLPIPPFPINPCYAGSFPTAGRNRKHDLLLIVLKGNI